MLIGGAGMAGLALAVALRQGLGEGFRVTVVDPALDKTPSDPRASAIVAAAQRLFQAIGVWDAVAEEAQPILDMVVTDSRLTDVVRPVFLTFDGDAEPGQPFAHMVENGPLHAALLGARPRNRRGAAAGRHCGGCVGGRNRCRCAARRRRALKAAAPGGGGRRALRHPRARRHPDPRLGLRAIRHRGDGRP